MYRFMLFIILLLVFQRDIYGNAAGSRQKRCIVFQKQSGTHGDSTEENSDGQSERFRPGKKLLELSHDAEVLPVDFLKRGLSPLTKINNELYKLRNKLIHHRLY
ncbi:unnamed protein product [Colias eurytheme]|nr:unnamed protein product [Colias eurytheme]